MESVKKRRSQSLWCKEQLVQERKLHRK
jgi:hypothetical protein